MAFTKTFSGARAIFYYNGTPVAYASGCNGSEEIIFEPIDVLDHIETMEFVPVGYRVTFGATIFRTIAQGSSSKDAPGSLKEQGIFPKFKDILTKEGVDAFIQDVLTGKTVFLVTETKAQRYDFSVTARGVMAQNMSFVAKRIMDESEVGAASA